MQSENIKVSNHSNIGVIIIFTWNTSDYCELLINEHITLFLNILKPRYDDYHYY